MNIKKDITNHKHSQTNSIVYFTNIKSETSQTSQPLFKPNKPNQTKMTRTSSSRPTTSRANQYKSPTGEPQQVHEQLPALEVPDWAKGSFTLYISYLHAHVPERMLFSVIRKTGIGMMRREGAIELTEHEPREKGGYPFQSAKIHFDFLFTRGDDAERNLQTMDHLLHGGDDAHFQVVYQAAGKNTKTGKDEPDRFWKVKVWREGLRSTSPPDSPAVKITLGGGVVGPKDAKFVAAPRVARVVTSGDGWSTVNTGPSSSKTNLVPVVQSEQKVGGGFAALTGVTKVELDSLQQLARLGHCGDPERHSRHHHAVGPLKLHVHPDRLSKSGEAWLDRRRPSRCRDQPTNQTSLPSTLTKSAKKNAKKNAKKKLVREHQQLACPKLFDVIDSSPDPLLVGPLQQRWSDAVAQNDTSQSFTEEELRELDDATDVPMVHQLSNHDIASEAAEFLAESQIRCEGAENCGAYEMDASTGSMRFHDEMTAADAETIVPPHEVLDNSAILTAQ